MPKTLADKILLRIEPFLPDSEFAKAWEAVQCRFGECDAEESFDEAALAEALDSVGVKLSVKVIF